MQIAPFAMYDNDLVGTGFNPKQLKTSACPASDQPGCIRCCPICCNWDDPWHRLQGQQTERHQHGLLQQQDNCKGVAPYAVWWSLFAPPLMQPTSSEQHQHGIFWAARCKGVAPFAVLAIWSLLAPASTNNEQHQHAHASATGCRLLLRHMLYDDPCWHRHSTNELNNITMACFSSNMQRRSNDLVVGWSLLAPTSISNPTTSSMSCFSSKMDALPHLLTNWDDPCWHRLSTNNWTTSSIACFSSKMQRRSPQKMQSCWVSLLAATGGNQQPMATSQMSCFSSKMDLGRCPICCISGWSLYGTGFNHQLNNISIACFSSKMQETCCPICWAWWSWIGTRLQPVGNWTTSMSCFSSKMQRCCPIMLYDWSLLAPGFNQHSWKHQHGLLQQQDDKGVLPYQMQSCGLSCPFWDLESSIMEPNNIEISCIQQQDGAGRCPWSD